MRSGPTGANRERWGGIANRRQPRAARGCGSTDPSRRPAGHLVGPAVRGRSSRRRRPAKPNSPSRPSQPQSVWSCRWSSRGAAVAAGASVAWADAGPASARVRPRPRRPAATRWGDRRCLIVLCRSRGHGGEPYATVGTPRRGQPARPHPAPGPDPVTKCATPGPIPRRGRRTLRCTRVSSVVKTTGGRFPLPNSWSCTSSNRSITCRAVGRWHARPGAHRLAGGADPTVKRNYPTRKPGPGDEE